MIMNFQKKRWIILVASCMINLCIGSIYAWRVFAGPMAVHLKVDTGSLFRNCFRIRKSGRKGLF